MFGLIEALVSQIDPDSVNKIIKNTDVQKSIKSILNTGTPVTDQKFVFLGFAISLSLYLSALSREITQKLIKKLNKPDLDNNEDQIEEIAEKILNLSLVIWMDLILWFLFIFPSVIISVIWFINLAPTNSYFTFLRSWLFVGFLAVVILMFLFHLFQFGLQINIIKTHRNFTSIRMENPIWNLLSFFVVVREITDDRPNQNQTGLK